MTKTMVMTKEEKKMRYVTQIDNLVNRLPYANDAVAEGINDMIDRIKAEALLDGIEIV